jgi:hypothetical protein
MGDPWTVKVRRRAPNVRFRAHRVSLRPDTGVLRKAREGPETLALTLLFATADS